MNLWGKVKEGFKDDINKAKVAAFDKKMSPEYIGGMPGVRGKSVQIVKNTQTGDLKLEGRVIQLRNIQWQESATRSAGKAAAGAIIGSLVGPVGTIAGAAIGGRKKDRSQAILTVGSGDKEYSVYVRCDQDEFRELTAYLS